MSLKCITKPVTLFETIFFWFSPTLLCIVVLCVLFVYPLICHASSPRPSELSQSEILRLGEQLYRQGILPDGTPMPGFIRGDVEVDSSAFSCSSCHLRAGLGSFEGGVILHQLQEPSSINPIDGHRP